MLMHFLATLAMVAGVAQYVIPVSGSTCVVAHRVMTAAMVLFDVSGCEGLASQCA